MKNTIVYFLIGVCLLVSACKSATFEDAWAYQDQGLYSKAIPVYEALSEKRDIRAQVELGNIYSMGEHLNHALAFKYYKAAADSGDIWANFRVGNYYEEGEVVEKNMGYAEKRYLESANQGLVLAMNALVDLYKNESLLSYEEAVKKRRHWAVSAFERGWSLAAFDVAETYRFGSADSNAWKDAYIDAALESGRTNVMFERSHVGSAEERLKILLIKQDIMRLYNHIEPAKPMPWRD